MGEANDSSKVFGLKIVGKALMFKSCLGVAMKGS